MAELISTLPRHSESASLSLCLNEVAQILIAQKDYEQAESIANQSLAALPRNFSKYEPLVYETLSSAASLQGKYSLAIENTQKALERLAQTEREDRSRLLVDLSALLILNNQLDKAADTVTSAMSISDDAELQTRGEICLAKIAGLRQRNDEAISHFGKASELLQSLAPAEILLHKMEIANAKCLMNLQSKKYAEAKLLALESADLTNSYINSFLSQLSFAKQCSFVENTIQPQSDLLLTVLKANPDSDFSGQVYSRIMPWKGILVHSLYRETRLLQLAQASKNSSGSQNNETFAELTRTRNELTLTGKSRSSNTDLTGQQEALERKLWKAFKALGIDDPMSTTSVNQLQAKLRPGEVLVDIFEFTDLLEKDSRNICSRAFILTADGGNNVGLVSLEFHWGPEDKITSWLTSIEKTSLAARETGEASPSAQKHNEPKLRTELKAELWNPIETALPKDTRTTFVSPSARLATLPWNLLANDESDFLFVNVDSARQFVQGRNKQLDAKADSAKTMLLVGDIDFKDPAVSPLPGTSQEIASIKDLASGQNYVCELLERSLADKEKVRSQFPQHKIVHLATHEFFLQTKAPENKAAIDMIALSRVTEPDMSADRRNILLKSGIYLAPDTSAGTKSGATILTAEDLIALPLNGCKLVTLSAGETGMGDAIRAQGVLGLRASLIAAGADSVLMSIWRAPDEAKERLLTEFYSNLLVKNMPAAEALREAQCAMKKVPDFSAPWNWAGWIIVGIGH